MDDGASNAAALGAAIVLALVHVLAGRLVALRGIPRNRWLSAAAGVSVAYVFVHLLPELAAADEKLAEATGGEGFLEDRVYLVALVGLAVFYGVEQHSLASRRERRDTRGTDRTADGAFWLSMASFALYNAVIGYLLVHGETDTLGSMALFTAALGVHFVVNDYGLREHHREAYDRLGRWLLAVAVVAGWGVAQVAEVSEAALGVLIAFIAGGVVLNVMKEELPGERQARVVPFLAGAGAYAVLLEAV